MDLLTMLSALLRTVRDVFPDLAYPSEPPHFRDAGVAIMQCRNGSANRCTAATIGAGIRARANDPQPREMACTSAPGRC
jgi:hypothetical protein